MNEMNVPNLLYQATGLEFSYSLGNSRVEALRGVDLTLQLGKLSCLTGPSGSGKSTLLNLLGLIEPLQKGALHFLGHDFRQLQESQRNRIRRFEIGFVFQSFQLFPVLSAAENVSYFLIKQGLDRKSVESRVEQALGEVGLWEHRAKKPLEMSGGQRQRVAVARALAKHPKVIIADEPTASLDQKTGRTVMDIFKKLSNEGVSIVISSHDPMVLEYADVEHRMRDGQLI